VAAALRKNGFDVTVKTAQIKAGQTVTLSAALAEETGPQPGQAMSVDLGNGVKMGMVWIAPGSFMRRSQRVTLTKGYWMGKCEVTQEQWQQVMGNNPSNFKGVKNPCASRRGLGRRRSALPFGGLVQLPSRVPAQPHRPARCFVSQRALLPYLPFVPR